MKPARAKPRRKPLSETHQTVIACSVVVGLIAGLVYTLGYIYPPKATTTAFAIPAADVTKPVKSDMRGPQ
jgi:hypothetical protein